MRLGLRAVRPEVPMPRTPDSFQPKLYTWPLSLRARLKVEPQAIFLMCELPKPSTLPGM